MSSCAVGGSSDSSTASVSGGGTKIGNPENSHDFKKANLYYERTIENGVYHFSACIESITAIPRAGTETPRYSLPNSNGYPKERGPQTTTVAAPDDTVFGNGDGPGYIGMGLTSLSTISLPEGLYGGLILQTRHSFCPGYMWVNTSVFIHNALGWNATPQPYQLRFIGDFDITQETQGLDLVLNVDNFVRKMSILPLDFDAILNSIGTLRQGLKPLTCSGILDPQGREVEKNQTLVETLCTEAAVRLGENPDTKNPTPNPFPTPTPDPPKEGEGSQEKGESKEKR